jgi:signal transduction histidine kinase
MLHLNEVVNIQNPLLLESSKQNLHSYIRNVIYILDTQIKKKNAIINSLVSENIEINYNPAYLDSILLNLISNALKYSSPDRQPIIHIECKALPGNAEGHQWALSIKDNGLGIDLKNNGHKLFGMYKTFHGNADAKGIGLFITKNQIESMGGSISVESAPNEGTTFIIKIA